MVGPQRQFPERQFHAFGGQSLLHKIVLAHGSRARRDQNVGADFARPSNRRDRIVEPVGDNPEVNDFGAFRARESTCTDGLQCFLKNSTQLS
jgi:hypothetical protein